MSGVTVALVVIAVTALVGYCKWKLSYWAKKGIFSPPANLFLGHMPVMFNATQIREIFFDKFYRQGEKVVGIYETHKPCLIINDLDLIQKILIKDFDHFVDRRTINTYNKEDEIFQNMLTTASGSHWKSMRSILTPTFTSGKMKNMFPLVQEKARGLIRFCEPSSENGLNIEFMSVLGKVSLDIIGTCVFGLEIDSLNGGNKDFAEAASKVNKPTLELFGKFILMTFFPWVAKTMKVKFMSKENKFLEDIMKETLKKRKTGAKRGDFVDLLLESSEIEGERKEEEDDKKKKFKLNDVSIVAQAFLFLIAGFDTTSNSLSFFVKALGMYPDYQKTIREELIARMKADGRDKLTYEDVMEAKWLEAFLAETLRMYPPAPATERKCTKPYPIPGTSYTIPVDMIVGVQIWSLHHDEHIFPDPFNFKPERFLPENKQTIPTAAYIPFGIGPRMCIAQRFALMNMKILVAELLLSYSISLAEGYEDMKLSKMPGLIRQQDGTLQIVLKPVT